MNEITEEETNEVADLIDEMMDIMAEHSISVCIRVMSAIIANMVVSTDTVSTEEQKSDYVCKLIMQNIRAHKIVHEANGTAH